MKLPAFQFYPGDWRKDENLSRCSLQAKGALIEIMCIAFQCEKKGVLMSGGKPWTIEDVSMAIGGDISVNKKSIELLFKTRFFNLPEPEFSLPFFNLTAVLTAGYPPSTFFLVGWLPSCILGALIPYGGSTIARSKYLSGYLFITSIQSSLYTSDITAFRFYQLRVFPIQ